MWTKSAGGERLAGGEGREEGTTACTGVLLKPPLALYSKELFGTDSC